MNKLNPIKVGTSYQKLTRCPVCDKRAGFEEIDSMCTSRCAYCGSRFLQSPFGIEYVGSWETYACKDMYSLPLRYQEVRNENI